MSAQFRIVSSSTGSWAKNFPALGPPPVSAPIIWDQRFAGQWERWMIAPFQGGATIRNVGTGFWAYANGDQVFTSSEFDPSTCKWYIERAGGNQVVIKVPDQDLVWTLEDDSVSLNPADGTPEQRFELVVIARV